MKPFRSFAGVLLGTAAVLACLALSGCQTAAPGNAARLTKPSAAGSSTTVLDSGKGESSSSMQQASYKTDCQFG